MVPAGDFAVDAPWDTPGRRWRYFAAPMGVRELRELVEPQMMPDIREWPHVTIWYVRIGDAPPFVLNDHDEATEGDLIRVRWTDNMLWT